MKTDKDKTIEELVEELEFSVNKKLEDWKILKEDLTGRRLTNCEQHMKKISVDEAEKLLPIMKKLEE
ncbi:MAG: hypothetical protein Q8N77_00855, partial [Nanoarchaeota archaeon]|nr:hypothetical protein [Nanoarchaeota archaeon]